MCHFSQLNIPHIANRGNIPLLQPDSTDERLPAACAKEKFTPAAHQFSLLCFNGASPAIRVSALIAKVFILFHHILLKNVLSP